MSDNMHANLGWPHSLKGIMQERGITHNELANSIGVSPGLIGHYLKGIRVPSFKRVADIAKALNVAPQELLFGGKIEQEAKLKLLLEVPVADSLSEMLELKSHGKSVQTKRTITMEKTSGFIPAHHSFGIDITDDLACPYLFECKAHLPYPYKVIALIDPNLKPHKGHAIIVEEDEDFKIRQLQMDGTKLVTHPFDNSAALKPFDKNKYLGTIVSFALDYPPPS